MKKPNLIPVLLSVTSLSGSPINYLEWNISNGYSINFFKELVTGMLESVSGATHFNEII